MSERERTVVTVELGEPGPGQSPEDLAKFTRDAVEEGLRDRYVSFKSVRVEKVKEKFPSERADLPVGTRVVVTPLALEHREPFTAKIVGYDIHRTKYRMDYELPGGRYTGDGLYWAFLGQVEIHPDGPEPLKEKT